MGALDEIEHVVNYAGDAKGPGTPGECESLLNRMRRELGLAERAEYYFTPLPGAANGDFVTRYVRLAFERRENSRTRRYWLYWDASLTGGYPPEAQLAATR